MSDRRRLIIAIDGPSGAGKGTVARGVAARLGYRHVDTGAMYRAVAWKAQRDGVDLADEAAVAALGERRAHAVYQYLTGRGIAASRVYFVTFGEERPKYDNSREETRRLNRRAAMVVRLDTTTDEP